MMAVCCINGKPPCRLWTVLVAVLLSMRGAVGMAAGELPLEPPRSAMETPEPPAGPTVVDVRVAGNRSLSVRAISPHILTRKDRPFDPDLVENDVRRLTRSGLFVDVKPYYRDVPGGRVVIFEVVERPRVQYIKFVGNEKIKRKLLEKQIDLKQGDAIDPYMVADARHKIEEFYHNRGHVKAQVEIVEGDKAGDPGVVFLINEGEKKRILWTQFVGNTIAGDDRLRTQIQSKPGFLWFFKGEVKRELIDEDVNRLVAYYRGLGFLRARVGRELSHDVARNWVVLTFVIDEGPRYQVRRISTVGNEIIDSGKLTSDLKLRESQFFNDLGMKSDVASIQEQYGSIGYVFANVRPNIRYIEDEAQVDLVYDVEEGDRYRVGRIDVNIAGEFPHTKVATVLNRLSFKPGDIVDVRELRDSERRLRSSGLFSVDPMSGDVPKIVFSPPSLDEEIVAEKPRRTSGPSGFRGQSPEPSPQGANAARPEPLDREDRWVVLTLLGRLLDEPAASDQSVPPQAERSSDGRGHTVRFQSPSSGRSMPPLPSTWNATSAEQAPQTEYAYPYAPPTPAVYPDPTYSQPAQPAMQAPATQYGANSSPSYQAAPFVGAGGATSTVPPSGLTTPAAATPQPVYGNQFPMDPVQSGGQGQLAPRSSRRCHQGPSSAAFPAPWTR
ncbi:MAG: POTRA domain-containing protein [Patescibacteria group bacterium]|nr:POTRA domain-containing protein [Patescibacteria group bacterium]